jgi:hypothetical protein
MDRLNQLGGVIIPFQRSNGISGHVCITPESQVYAYLLIPDEIELPYKLDVTTSNTFIITKHGYIYLGFPEEITTHDEIKTTKIYSSRIQALKNFKY